MDKETKLHFIWANVIIVCLLGLILPIVCYQINKNQLIEKAKTCEQAVVINGAGNDLNLAVQIAACKISKIDVQSTQNTLMNTVNQLSQTAAPHAK